MKETQFEEYLKFERRLAQTTINSYMFYVAKFNEFICKDAKEVREEDIQDFIKHLEIKQVCNGGISNHVAALRVFYNFLSYKHKTEPIYHISFFLNKIVKVKQDRNVPNILSYQEVEILKKYLYALKEALTFNKYTKEYGEILRDIAIIELLPSLGARSGEIRGICRYDIDTEAGEALIRRAKGGKQRVSIFGDAAKAAVMEYMKFKNFHPQDRIFPIRGAVLNGIIKRRLSQAGILNRATSHTFRHYHVTEAQRNGVPIQSVAEQVGHDSLNTTVHYTHLDTEHRRNKYASYKY